MVQGTESCATGSRCSTEDLPHERGCSSYRGIQGMPNSQLDAMRYARLMSSLAGPLDLIARFSLYQDREMDTCKAENPRLRHNTQPNAASDGPAHQRRLAFRIG